MPTTKLFIKLENSRSTDMSDFPGLSHKAFRTGCSTHPGSMPGIGRILALAARKREIRALGQWGHHWNANDKWKLQRDKPIKLKLLYPG